MPLDSEAAVDAVVRARLNLTKWLTQGHENLELLTEAGSVINRALVLSGSRGLGRAYGMERPSSADLEREVTRMTEAAWRSAGHRPSLSTVAVAMAYSPDGLSRALRRVGTDWNRVCEAAEGHIAAGQGR